jgi:[ribosomal protein S5]-alanine N-acetyltransferase
MATSPPMDTDRLRIVPFSEEHLTERYVSWLNDPDVTKFSEQRLRKHSLESSRKYFESFHESPNYFWALLAKDLQPDSLLHIGNISAYIDTTQRRAEIAVLNGERSSWGKGYASEGLSKICEFLLGPAGMRKVYAGVMAYNIGSIGMLRKAGFIDDGRQIRHFLWGEEEVDVVNMARF